MIRLRNSVLKKKGEYAHQKACTRMFVVSLVIIGNTRDNSVTNNPSTVHRVLKIGIFNNRFKVVYSILKRMIYTHLYSST